MKALRSSAPLLGILVVTTGYAVVRYNVLKGVGWDHLPFHVLNKAVAWSATTLMLLASAQALARRTDLRTNGYLAQAVALSGLHVLMSLALLGVARYPDLYDASQQLTLVAELAILAGVLGAACALLVRRHALAVAALPIATAVHCTALGARNWLRPSMWPGHMLPITLLCAATATAAALAAVAWVRRRD